MPTEAVTRTLRWLAGIEDEPEQPPEPPRFTGTGGLVQPAAEIQPVAAPTAPIAPETPPEPSVAAQAASWASELPGRVGSALEQARPAADAALAAAERLPGPVGGIPNPVPIVRGIVQATEPAAGLPRKATRLDEINDQAMRETGRTDARALLGREAARDPGWRVQNPELAAEFDEIERDVSLNVGLGLVGDAGRFARGGRFIPEVAPSLQQAAGAIDAAAGALRAGAGRAVSGIRGAFAAAPSPARPIGGAPSPVWGAVPGNPTGATLDLVVDGEPVVRGAVNTSGEIGISGNATRDPDVVPGAYWNGSHVMAPEAQRGKGYGSQWYQEVLRRAADSGVDGSIAMNPSDEAARVYDAMVRWPGGEVTPLRSFESPRFQTPRLVRSTDPAAFRAALDGPQTPGLGQRIRGALEGNAARVAAADARIAAEGSTMAPASFGVVPAGGDDVSARLAAASRAVDRAEEVGTDAEVRAAQQAYDAVRREYDAAVAAAEAERAAGAARSAQMEGAGYGRPMEEADTLPSEMAAPGGVTRSDVVPPFRQDRPSAGAISLNAGLGALPEGGGRRWVADARYPGGGFWHTPAARVPEDLRAAQREVTLRNADALGARRSREAAEALSRQHPDDPELQQRLVGALRAEEEAQSVADAAREWQQMVTTGDRTLATAGTVPAGTTGGTGPLGAVNRALGEGIAGGVGGAVIEQARNPDEDPRTAAARGFAAGAVGFPVGSRILRGAVGRATGRAAAEAPGALASLGPIPTRRAAAAAASGAPPPSPGLLERLPGVKQALAASSARAARMAANPSGPQPLGPLQWTGEALKSVGYSAMIGPATATVNLLGNAVEPLLAIPKETVRAVSRGAPREALTMAGGAFHGLKRSGDAIVDALAARGRYASHPDQPRLSERTINPLGHAVASGLETGGRLFTGVPDALFGSIARHAGEAREAAQIATDMGLSGRKYSEYIEVLLDDVEALRENPTTRSTSDNARRVLASGEQYADRQTFRDELGTVGKGAAALAGRNVPVWGNLVTPFFNTPWNMGLRLAERGPAGFAMNSQKTRFDKYYDATVGSALVAGIAFGPAAAGMITGSGPDDPEKRKMLQAEGWRPYHTLIGGQYVPNRYFGIYGKLLNAAGEAHDAVAYQKQGATTRELGEGALKRFGKLLKEEPYLQGLSDIMGALTDPQATGGAEGYASSLLTRMVPYAATARTIGTSMDPSARELDRGPSVGIAENIGQRVKQGLGIRGDLAVAQDVLGRPIPNPEQRSYALLPGLSTPSDDPVISAFQQAGVDIGAPPDQVTVGGGGTIPLTPAEQRQWQALRGQVLIDHAARMTAAPWWSNPEARTKGLESLLRQANTAASAQIQAQIGAEEVRRRAREAVEQKRRAS